MARSNSEQRDWRIVRVAHIAPFLVVVFLCMALHACSTETSGRDLVMVNPDEAINALQGRSGVLGIGKTTTAWVDPRTLEAYRKAHIPGAIHLSFAMVSEDHEDVLKDIGVIVVYGDDYNDAVAIAMSKRLMELGYKDVRTLNGGLRQWTSQGHAVETGDPTTKTASN